MIKITKNKHDIIISRVNTETGESESFEYDSDNRLVHYVCSNGNWIKYTYATVIINEQECTEILELYPDGTWYKRLMDEFDNEVYYENSAGNWIKRKYIYSTLLYEERSNGYWRIVKYDDDDMKISDVDSDGKFEYYDYDEFNNIIFYRDNTGFWERKAFNSSDFIILKQDSNGTHIEYEYI